MRLSDSYRSCFRQQQMAVLVALFAIAGYTQAADIVPAKPGPIVDTHIHLYQVSRPSGVPWPKPIQKPLYRDVLPAEYQALARKHGVVATGIVEASSIPHDNQFVLDLVKGNKFFPFFVASLEIGSPTFVVDLQRLAKDPRVVGIRGFSWSPKMILDSVQLDHVRALAKLGMTLDIISRGDMNPKAIVSRLASEVPQLRIIIDHLGGAAGKNPTPQWELDMRRLADRHPNIVIKFSSFFDTWNPRPDENLPWKAPTDLASYKPHFDVLMSAFGPDRLIWASNWPVCDMGGDFATQIKLAEEFLAPFGQNVRDKVMFKNARSFYRRVPPN